MNFDGFLGAGVGLGGGQPPGGPPGGPPPGNPFQQAAVGPSDQGGMSAQQLFRLMGMPAAAQPPPPQPAKREILPG